MKRNTTSLFTPVLFFGFLAAVLLCALLLPTQLFSLSEHRRLARKPVNDLTDLPALIGQYSDYAADHFPFREELLTLESGAQIRARHRLIRKVTVAYQEDGAYLLPEVYPIDPGKRLTLVSRLAAQMAALPQVDFVYAILPQKNNLLGSETMDARISDRNRQAYCEDLGSIESLTLLDVGGRLSRQLSAPECRGMYYRTDFHWNHRGAFLAARQIASGMQEAGLLDGVTLPAKEDFIWQELGQTHSYLGDLNRRFAYQFPTQEDIPFYALADTADIRYFSTGDAPAVRSSIIASGLSEPALTYAYLSTENVGYYRVSNPHARSDRRVLILKDSLENPMTDYFTALFSELVVVDLRGYEEPYSLAELIEAYDLDTVLLMFHQNNLSAELSDFLAR